MNDERWVEERLQALDPGSDWQPDAGRAYAGLQRRDRRRRLWQRGWTWSTATAFLAAAVLFALPTPARCAIVGVGCPRPMLAAAAAPLGAPLGVDSPASYKELGSPQAPIVIEIYTDYECPHCATFYNGVYPQLVAEYVKTGKVRVVHRDFPLPQHPHAKLAARYANAAGELGDYEDVVRQLFSDQPEWSANGNVDASVAKVAPAETMRKIRALVASDSRLDATVASDMSMVMKDRIGQTPTVVFVYKGVRRKVIGIESFGLLKTYLDEMLKK
jgi:protein-disulfide isomerase